MVPLDFIDARPCFPQQDIFFWGYAEWSLVFKYFGTFGKIVGSASLVNSHFPRSSRTVDYRLKILFYLLTYLKIKHRHRFSTFQTCTNLFQSVQPTGCYCSVWQPGLAVGYISVTSRSRFAGRVAPAFTESKSIHFHTRFAGRVAPAFTESKSIHFHTRFAGRVAPAFTESKSIHFHTRFAGRVAPAFTESKSIHFQTNLSGASRNNWYYSVGYWCNGTNLAYILPKICIISL